MNGGVGVTYRPYPSDSRYLIGSDGTVYRKLCAYNHGGYKAIKVRTKSGAKNKYLHQLVAETFIGKTPRGMLLRFRNKDNSDCSVDNLCFIPLYASIHATAKKATRKK